MIYFMADYQTIGLDDWMTSSGYKRDDYPMPDFDCNSNIIYIQYHITKGKN